MAGKLISVVIPTRHRNDLLSLCLRCLAPGTQTLSADEYEVIVTDDGSTSTAEEMIREQHPWVHWTGGPRKGPAANRNHGASLARGEWIAFTDDDCLPSPQWLTEFKSGIRDSIQVYEGQTTCLAGVKSPLMHAPINTTGGWLWSCNMMVKRSLFERSPFDESFPHPHMEDTYFRERLKMSGIPFVFIPAATVDHPPRLIPPGYKWAMTHECEVIYNYKMDLPQPSTVLFLWKIAKARARKIARFPVGVDTFVSSYHVGVELICVIANYRGWKRRHLTKSRYG